MLRVALLADTHGFLDPRILSQLMGCDVAIHAGDVGNRGVLEAMQSAAKETYAVLGNNDVPAKWPAADLPWLEALPQEATISLPGGDIVVVHGHLAGAPRVRHDRLRQRYPEAKLVVYGHSHRRCIDKSAASWVVNPGAAGKARTYGGPSCIMLTVETDGWRLRTRRFEPLRKR